MWLKKGNGGDRECSDLEICVVVLREKVQSLWEREEVVMKIMGLERKCVVVLSGRSKRGGMDGSARIYRYWG